MADVSAVGAAVAAGLLSGGGAGFLVSWYAARRESEDRKAALELERDKFEHERGKWESERANYRAQKTDFLSRTRALFGECQRVIYDYDDSKATPRIKAKLQGEFSQQQDECMRLQIGLVYCAEPELAENLADLINSGYGVIASDSDTRAEAMHRFHQKLIQGNYTLGRIEEKWYAGKDSGPAGNPD